MLITLYSAQVPVVSFQPDTLESSDILRTVRVLKRQSELFTNRCHATNADYRKVIVEVNSHSLAPALVPGPGFRNSLAASP